MSGSAPALRSTSPRETRAASAHPRPGHCGSPGGGASDGEQRSTTATKKHQSLRSAAPTAVCHTPSKLEAAILPRCTMVSAESVLVRGWQLLGSGSRRGNGAGRLDFLLAMTG